MENRVGCERNALISMDSRSWFDLGEYSNEANRINPEFAVLENLQRCAPHFHVFQ